MYTAKQNIVCNKTISYWFKNHLWLDGNVQRLSSNVNILAGRMTAVL